MKRILCRAITAAVAAAWCQGTALAQTQVGAPSGAVSRGAGGVASDPFKLSIDFVEAYDENVMVRSGDASIPIFQGSGAYTMLTPTLDFTSRGERAQLVVSAGANGRYYGSMGELLMTSETVGSGLSVRFSPQTTLSLYQGVTRSAALLSGLFGSSTPVGGDVATAGLTAEYALNTANSYASTTAASLKQQLSRRAAILFSSDVQYTVASRDSGYPDVHSHDIGGLFTYSLSRDTGIRLGYTFKQGQYTGSPTSAEHDLNIGIDYSRPLSRTRRTSLTFGLGPAIVNAPLLNGSTDVRRQYRLVADASLVHQMGRTWSLQGSYHRGMGYIQGFQSPVFTGAYSAGASGFLSRRADLSLSAAYSTGESALTGTPSEFTTYTGDARLRIAVNRMWAAYVEYLFYFYEFNQQLPLPPDLPSGLTRNGVRTGLTMWIPLRHK